MAMELLKTKCEGRRNQGVKRDGSKPVYQTWPLLPLFMILAGRGGNNTSCTTPESAPVNISKAENRERLDRMGSQKDRKRIKG